MARHYRRQVRRLIDDAGFTLVELLVVLAVLALMAGIAGPRVIGYLDDSRVKTARIQIENLKTSIDLFKLDVGRLPTATEGLVALVERPASSDFWQGPYLKDGVVPKDPWGNAYLYRVSATGDEFELVSFGADGKEGGAGNATDVSSKRRQ